VGAVVAGVSGLAIVAALLVFLLRKRRRRYRVTPANPGVNDRTGSQKATSPFIIDGGTPQPSLPRLGTMNYGDTNYGPNNGGAFPLPQLQTNIPPPGADVRHEQSPSYLSNGGVVTTTGTPYQYPFFTTYGQQPAFPPSTISPSMLSDATRTASASGSGSNSGAGYGAYPQVLTATTTSPASPQPQQQNAGRAFPRDTRIKHTYQQSDNSAPSPASPPVPPPPSSAAPPPELQRQQPHPSFPADPRSDSPPRKPLPIPIPHAQTPTRSPHGALQPMASNDAISQVRFERDAGPLESSTPVEEVLIMPPEYEDARQPWERPRDDI
jgi:hypothetical protein